MLSVIQELKLKDVGKGVALGTTMGVPIHGILNTISGEDHKLNDYKEAALRGALFGGLIYPFSKDKKLRK